SLPSSTTPLPPPPTLFPYTTLFRSLHRAVRRRRRRKHQLRARSFLRRASRAPALVGGQPLGARGGGGPWRLRPLAVPDPERAHVDRKSTRLNSSHVAISYAVFCLKK